VNAAMWLVKSREFCTNRAWGRTIFGWEQYLNRIPKYSSR